MGSYSELYLGRLFIGGDKNGINPIVMSLFRESDKRIRQLRADECGAYHVDDRWCESNTVTVVEYAASAPAIRDRLELMGFTLQTSRRAFDAAMKVERERHAAFAAAHPGGALDDYIVPVSDALQELTPDSWINALQEIERCGLRPSFRRDADFTGLPASMRFMLEHHVDGWYGFPAGDVRPVIRLAIEALPGAELTYDLTDLISGGYFDSADEITAEADYLLSEDFVVSRRVIVLTEGATDKWILERSLRLLLPHLADFFAFMDFEGAKVAGGAGALAAMVKAFVGAGILNRVIAVFDNDTAGSSAIRSLRAVALPPNIAIVQYPRLPLAREYPTIGPTGSAIADVNGQAASVELYLGRDVLETDCGLAPVRWRGYDDSLRQYQGEIAEKREVLKRFREKLATCEGDRSKICDFDWSGLELILDAMRCAFHESDAETHIAFAGGGL